MEKYNYDSLCIEVTRKCNMQCQHCMRGEAANVSIKPDYIDTFFEHVESICTLTFTGGEPTLNLDAIEHTLEVVKKRQIPVDSFYLVTNGKVVSDRFLHLMIDWTVYCMQTNPYAFEDELGGVALSQDMFHEKIPVENFLKLKTLAVFHPDDKKTDWNRIPPIALGRAENLYVCTREKNHCEPHVDEYNCVEGPVTLTSTGVILSDCDYAYSEARRLRIGNVKDMETLFAYYQKRKRNEMLGCA